MYKRDLKEENTFSLCFCKIIRKQVYMQDMQVSCHVSTAL